ncbi:nuclear transport factor 2 family protein [Echinimonas agarilytica]|uniref:nuclear transport factor 2 family protein n=1 Tax=Echinimonas agarilytica TaxID=1215918 RepID=UPI0032E43615
MESRPPFPPFDVDSAAIKVRKAEDAWNRKTPSAVALAYSPESQWRNRSAFIQGRAEIEAFLANKWATELEYRLCKELWAYTDNRIAVRFAYEWHDTNGQWYRSYGNENWQFNQQGLMELRIASINDVAIDKSDRTLIWTDDVRPEDYPSLSELGL